jgi:hypothetical protein
MQDSFKRLFLALLTVALCVPLWAGEGNPTEGSAATSSSASLTSVTSKAEGDAALSPALLGLLVMKGVLTTAEANTLRSVPASSGMPQLLDLLKAKGVVSDADLAQMSGAAGASQPAVSASLVQTPAKTEATPAPQAKPPAPKVVAAVAPVRVLPIDAPKREGLVPDLKIGPVRVKPYGFYKTSAVYDSSSPGGNDFPLPGFLGDTGPDASPEFHIKARALRIGTNFEWVDVSPKLTLTGKFEIDFEGNFSRVNNRNISTIRSSAPQIRLGWARLDYAASSTTTIFALFGQDWTPFGSTTLPNLLESTGLGVGFGSLYERAPLIKGGFIHNFGGSRSFKLSPEVAIVMPAFGNLPSDLGNQLGFGERQGADSARPEVEARIVAQFQLDKAAGVAPAQVIVSGVQGRREAIVTKAAIPLCTGTGCTSTTQYQTAFSRGAKVSSERYGVSAEVQLPTRYITVTGKAYRGADLRFFFVGQLFSTFNDTLGLTDTATAASIDGSSTVAFGLRGGTPVVAPQQPVRTNGGFIGVGLPLSRLAHADPAGRNAGWTLNLHWGIDQVNASDIKRLTATAGQRYRSDLFAGNLQYKLNAWVTFGFEQSLYRTKAIASQSSGTFPLFEGAPARQANDRRSEFATIFTF